MKAFITTDGKMYRWGRPPLPPPTNETAHTDILLMCEGFDCEELEALIEALPQLDGNTHEACLYGFVAGLRRLEYHQMPDRNVERPGERWMIAYVGVQAIEDRRPLLGAWLVEALAAARGR